MLKIFGGFIRRTERASVAVEFALIASLLLFPLIGGATDFMLIIAAKAQVNITMQALYYSALAYPGITSANINSYAQNILTVINSEAMFHVSTSTTSPPSLSYVCYTVSSTTAPTFSSPSSTDSCTTSQETQTYANYTITTSVSLPFPVPGISSPYTISSTGMVSFKTSP
ncbi:MAG: hypothetical protein B7Z75_12855 [Acidocella sp. 20-57-95]|nr:MAG: hypothetical protein B7Z75_12855 [Acidocella sp. 20-57-95]OYV60873.1 MAG: hypothetical protein B7Z71_05535 [Acidocella sp. 21-58-7]HQT63491.1 hypothetical protein [Acidocella sp.]HQU04495.1 hypothetical protein [Acidocella sp.]